MYNTSEEQSKNKKIIAIITVVLFVIVVLVVGWLLNKEPVEKQIRIDNLSEFINDMPKKTENNICEALYSAIANSVQDGTTVPEKGAKIRTGSVTNNFIKEQNMHYGSFIVDIDEVKQTYRIDFEWSDDEKNPYYSGYRTLVKCPKEEEMKYKTTFCKDDMRTGTIQESYPILSELPLKVDYFANNYTKHVKYKITYKISDDEQSVTIKIIDYMGNGYDEALEKIEELGYDPDDYEIEYELGDD